MTTYRIVRFSFNNGRENIFGMGGLSLDEAQAHCQDPETSSRTATGADASRLTRKIGPWFDGYEKEDDGA
jgi:hypothetical protein